MAVVNVRGIPEELHRALKHRAIRRGRSTEAEIRHLLRAAVLPPKRVRIGSELAAFGKRFGGLCLDITRDHTPMVPATLE